MKTVLVADRAVELVTGEVARVELVAGPGVLVDLRLRFARPDWAGPVVDVRDQDGAPLRRIGEPILVDPW